MAAGDIQIKIHGIPVVLTLDDAVALFHGLDTMLREAGRLLDDTEPLPGEALGWMAGAKWMRERAAQTIWLAGDREKIRALSLTPPSDSLAPAREGATIDPLPAIDPGERGR